MLSAGRRRTIAQKITCKPSKQTHLESLNNLRGTYQAVVCVSLRLGRISGHGERADPPPI
jgi:hypothetical protein